MLKKLAGEGKNMMTISCCVLLLILLSADGLKLLLFGDSITAGFVSNELVCPPLGFIKNLHGEEPDLAIVEDTGESRSVIRQCGDQRQETDSFALSLPAAPRFPPPLNSPAPCFVQVTFSAAFGTS